jgi:hypothetical protein
VHDERGVVRVVTVLVVDDDVLGTRHNRDPRLLGERLTSGIA